MTILSTAIPLLVLNDSGWTLGGLPMWLKAVIIAGGILILLILAILLIFKLKNLRAGKNAVSLEGEPVDAPEQGKDHWHVSDSTLASVTVEKGKDLGRVFDLYKQVTTIGRPGTRKNDIELTDTTVSKEQATLFYEPSIQEFFIRNESLTNPTRVNQTAVPDSFVLKEGDLIKVGVSLLRFKKENQDEVEETTKTDVDN